ncbi:hypothetical protein RN001_001819 [Aquatica leii]|uniref:peptidylprolyl isomerase n=1 Tax=Aquatica leii TaxID=1421715 RepID=A0AAN7PGL8_9COLE|nr:hypothetical protein RN001_001819 [Aquatica leii]
MYCISKCHALYSYSSIAYSTGILVSFMIGSLIFYNISSTEKLNHESSNEEEGSDAWEDILGSGSLLRQIITKGKPDTRPQRLQNCLINFECTLENGTIIEKKEKFKVQVGDYEVVQGLDLALGLMNEGEHCKLKVESRLAYGHKGLENLIPPDTNVIFDVELLSVETDDEPENLNIEQRRIKGNVKRERGNWWYSRGENQLAIQCYRRALDYLDEVEGGIQYPTSEENLEVSDAALQQLLEDRINVSNNMAAAQLKLELYDAALQSLQTVLRCQPDNVKALFRKARVYKAKNDIQAALSCLKKAEKLLPNDADIVKEILGLEKIKEKQKKSEKELARRMFNGLKSDKQMDKKRKSSLPKMLTWVTIGTTVAVGLAGLALYRFKFT